MSGEIELPPPSKADIVGHLAQSVASFLDFGEPVRWSEPDAAYVPDDRPEPELYRFMGLSESIYVYTDGDIERYNNERTDLDEIGDEILNLLAAWRKAKIIRIAKEN